MYLISTIQEPPGMTSPGASSSLAKPLIGNDAYNATYLCRLCCIAGDHDCAAAPRDTPRCACKLSGALRLLDRNRGRVVVSLTCRDCPWRTCRARRSVSLIGATAEVRRLPKALLRTFRLQGFIGGLQGMRCGGRPPVGPRHRGRNYRNAVTRPGKPRPSSRRRTDDNGRWSALGRL